MAKNEKQFFHKGGAQDTTAPGVAFADLIVGQAEDSDLVELNVINTDAVNAVTLTLADELDNILLVISIPANSGQVLNHRPVNLLDPVYLYGTQLDAFGNYFYRLLNGKKIRAKVSAATVKVRWKRMDF